MMQKNSVLFDEMALSYILSIIRKQMGYLAFNHGKSVTRVIASHSLVFLMIRGAFVNYKQSIANTFCSGSTHKELAVQIEETIKKLHSI